MPPEWAPHQATWISWPHKRESWPGKFEPVEPVMVRAVAALSRSETVRINVLDRRHEEHVQDLLSGEVARERVLFHRFPTNDAWCRDHGAIFVTREGGSPAERALALDFRFNAWGGKYPPFDLDDAIPAQMAAALGVPAWPIDMVLEGGSIDVNGRGALLTTEQCLLHPNRNPHLDKSAIEQNLRDLLGVQQIIWLGDGIAGDDTDGHVDDLTRFVAEATVITVVETRSRRRELRRARRESRTPRTRSASPMAGASTSSNWPCRGRSRSRATGCLPVTPISTLETGLC